MKIKKAKAMLECYILDEEGNKYEHLITEITEEEFEKLKKYS